MGLISISGYNDNPNEARNPFSGQSDPYLSLDTSVSYDEGPQGVIENTYNLEGVITGCSVTELMERRDALVNSFDWKASTGIINNIEISGVIKASPERQILPNDLSFESSTYIGSLGYSISLSVFTGFEADGAEDDGLFNKTHTETTSVAENGCITRNITIAAEPNSNLEHCNAATAANNWIKSQLQGRKLGAIERPYAYEIQSEGFDINPLTNALTYTRTESNCEEGKQNTADGGTLTGLHFAYCIESDSQNAQCPLETQEVTTTYNGEVYDTGKTVTELVSEIKTRLFPNTDGLTSFRATYNENESNVTFTATKVEDGNGNPLPVLTDLVINNYSLTTTTNYDTALGDVTVGSVNGRMYVHNPVLKSPLWVNTGEDADGVKLYNPSTMISTAKGVCEGPTVLTNESITYDNVKGGLSYTYAFGAGSGPDGIVPELEGQCGLGSWKVDYSPPLRQYEVMPNLNCADMILDLGFTSRGELAVAATAVSGSGCADTAAEVAESKVNALVNTILHDASDIQVEIDKATVDGSTVTHNYKASFKAESVISEGNVLGRTGEMPWVGNGPESGLY